MRIFTGQKIDALTMHGRTAKEKSDVPALGEVQKSLV